MQVLGDRLPMLAGDEVVDHSGLERTGPEQGNEGDDVVEAIREQAPDQVLHPTRFELEHGRRCAGSDEPVGVGIVGRQTLEVQRGLSVDPAPLVDRGQRPVDDGERAKPEKVELHQADRLDVVLVELGDRAGRTGLAVEGGEFGQASRGNYDAPGVLSGVAGQPFELARQVDDRPDVFVCFGSAPSTRRRRGARSSVIPSSNGMSFAI